MALPKDTPLQRFGSRICSILRNILDTLRRFDCLFFFVTVFYLELVFKCSTVRTGFGSNLFLILLFSASAANMLVLLASFTRKRKINRILKIILLFLMILPYGVEFFIFQEYNIFYDLNTIRNGAGGAATGFLDEIARLVFSFNGLFYIFLLIIPALLYLIFGKRFDKAKKMNWRSRTIAACAASVFLMVGAGLSHSSKSCAGFYDKEYNFPSAVSSFGLLTGMRLDLSKGSGGDGMEFEFEEAFAPVTETTTAPAQTVTTAPHTGTTETQTTTTTYGRNELDLDFAAIAEMNYGTIADLSNYVATLTPSKQNEYTGLFKGKNLIFLTAEAFTKEVIREDLTPTLYRLYTKGIQLTDYRQPASAGTTGGEFQNVFGLLPMHGGASFPNFTRGGNTFLTMSQQLNKQSYWGRAYHNNDYAFYSRHITHNQLGFSEGYIGLGSGIEEYVHYEWPESDADMITGSMKEYISEKHFNVYYMTVSGHSGYGHYGNAMSKKHWEAVEELDYSEPVKAYLAANLDLEEALTKLVKGLERKGIADDTVIVLSPDHFPYGLDENASYGNMKYLSELYGYNVTNTLQRDHNAAIIWSGCLEDMEPIVVDAPTSSLDLLPTLSNLFGVEFDSRLLPGRDVLSDAEAIYFDREYNWKTELGYYLSYAQTFYPNEGVDVPEGYVDRIKSIVRNKITYCQGVMNSNYFAYLAGLEP